ncbi:uncharacterized protein BYT42DRAFT_611513 [Radiomyces spectabilis]|uniref:uncharacterized protein n=1 Tax=Radiomyces spectabilis TaxID=64574 RepID=UPI002220AFE2|nr:uncharacterized protein BYT42DRAFT_611513 [Radiomyces spectabilis]KAI8388475.1 hypothetical protein BYT42DRAFT_611513 [Radiomyces spectabilis]
MTKLYKRGALRNALKRRMPHKSLDENVDILIYLNYILFTQRLAESTMEVLPPKTRRISGRDIERVAERVLQEFHG